MFLSGRSETFTRIIIRKNVIRQDGRIKQVIRGKRVERGIHESHSFHLPVPPVGQPPVSREWGGRGQGRTGRVSV